MLRLAGMRINPKTNGLHNTTFNSSLTLRKIPEGTEIKVDLPPNPKLSLGRWSPDATRFAFTNTTDRGIELWIGDTTGKTRQHRRRARQRRDGRRAAAADAAARAPAPPTCSGCPTARACSFTMVKPNRGPRPRRAPRAHRTARAGKPGRRIPRRHPRGHAAEPARRGPVRVLRHLASSRWSMSPPVRRLPSARPASSNPRASRPMASTSWSPRSTGPSPICTTRAQFPKEIEIWDRTGKVLHKVASQPLEDRVPINGVQHRTAQHSLASHRSRDPDVGGSARRRRPQEQGPHSATARRAQGAFHRRAARSLSRPSSASAACSSSKRAGARWSPIPNARRAACARFQIEVDDPGTDAEAGVEPQPQDRYRDPGTLMTKAPAHRRPRDPAGRRHHLPRPAPAPARTGDHPFLDRYNLATGQTRAPVPVRRRSLRSRRGPARRPRATSSSPAARVPPSRPITSCAPLAGTDDRDD